MTQQTKEELFEARFKKLTEELNILGDWARASLQVNGIPPAEREGPLGYKTRRYIQHVADGLTVEQIAREEDISPRTVESYLAEIRRRFKVSSTLELVVMFMRNGWIR